MSVTLGVCMVGPVGRRMGCGPGIVHRAVPERRFLLWSALGGVVIISLAHVSSLGNPLEGPLATLINGPAAHLQAWTAFVRAGASMIITYGARNARQWLESV